MARPTTEEDRKMPVGVSLSRAQRALFVQIGGSRWLQTTLDNIAAQMPKVAPRAPAKKKARAG